MKLFKSILLIGSCLCFLAGNAMALPFNSNRDGSWSLGVTSGNEPSLQQVMDQILGAGTIDAMGDQNSAAIWTEAELDVSSYLITFLSSNNGSLGIYSYSDPTKQYTFSLKSTGRVGFDVYDNGDIVVDDALGETTIVGFGSTFGFYYLSGNVTSYTEDSKNTNGGFGPDNNILSLSYLLASDTKVDSTGLANWLTINNYENWTLGYKNKVTTSGNNDWLLAFEDSPTGDGDFQDAIFLIEDMKPVPEPATMLLLGLGLVGLAGVVRKRMA